MIRPAPAFPAAALVLALTLSPLAAQAPADLPGGGGAPPAESIPSPSPALSLAAAPSSGAGEAPPAPDPTVPSSPGLPPVLPPVPEAPLPVAPPVPPAPPIPPVPPVPPVPTMTLVPGAAPSITVQVRPGDSITSIGRQFGVSSGAIKSANNISGDLLRVGQNLLIPVHPAPSPSAPQPQPSFTPGLPFPVVENVPVPVRTIPQPTASLSGFAFAPGTAPEPVAVLPPPMPDSPLLHDTRFDINFENRPASEVAAMLCERVAGVNIMLPGETGNIIIPSLSLKGVNLAEFMAALTAASQADMASGNDGYSLDPVPGAPNILIFRRIQIQRVAGSGAGADGLGGSGVTAHPGAPARIYGMGPDVRGRTPAAGAAPSISKSSTPALRAETLKRGDWISSGRGIPGGVAEGAGEGIGGSGAGAGAGIGGMPGSTGAAVLGGGEGSVFGIADGGAGLGGYGGGPVGGGYGYGGMSATPVEARSESAFLDLSPILSTSDLKIDDITTAIRTAWSSIEGGKTPPEGSLKFHQETKLLIITATPEYLHAATSIVALLQSRSEPSQDQKDQAIADLKRQIMDVTDSRTRVMKDLDSEMEKFRQSRENMQAKVAELEIELAKRARAAVPATDGKVAN